jgi:hypothetical protein
VGAEDTKGSGKERQRVRQVGLVVYNPPSSVLALAFADCGLRFSNQAMRFSIQAISFAVCGLRFSNQCFS